MHRGRILHMIDTGGPGGAETVFLELVSRLPSQGWGSVPIVPTIDWLAGALDALNIEAEELSAQRSIDTRYVMALRRVLRRERIDLVQTHLLGTSVYAALACLGSGVPVVSTFHGRPDIPSDERFRGLKTRLLRRNHIVCVSQSLKDYYVDRGDMADDSTVIANGIDLESFVPDGTTMLRKELGIADDVPLVGAVGNVRPSKAYPCLLEAFAIVRSSLPEAHLVIAGQQSGALYERLESLQGALGLGSCTHFLGFRSDVSNILAALDVFALSSSDEGFSLAMVQAMAMGLPVVATRSGGPEEIVGHSPSAILVEPNDPAALASAIVRLLTDRDLAKSLGVTAGHHVRERFSVRQMVEGYSALYERILRRREQA